MELSGFAGFLHRISSWIMRLAYVNLIWIGFTLLGGIVFGIGPASVGLFSVLRKMLAGEDFNIFSSFWHSFKRDFLKGNLLSLIFLGIGALIYYDLSIFKQSNGFFYGLCYWFFILSSLLYVMSLIYIFPVYVHYQLNLWGYMKYSVLIGLFSPVQTLFIFAGVFGVFVFETLVSGVLPFFCSSLPGIVIMFGCNHAFANLTRKRELMDNRRNDHET